MSHSHRGFRPASPGYPSAVPQVFPLAPVTRTQPAPLRAGEYYCTDRDLYRVEEVHGEFALIEDCRTEIELEVAVSEILAMDRVRSAASSL